VIKTTRKQREALFRIFQRDFPSFITPRRRHIGTKCKHCGQWSEQGEIRTPSAQYRKFRKTVQPYFGDTCIMVPWAGMWLGIETDGYTHS
jgi:hypothetical protein